jgi:hypothetical protein
LRMSLTRRKMLKSDVLRLPLLTASALELPCVVDASLCGKSCGDRG